MNATGQVGPVGTVVSGGMAGVALWTAIFPADVVKSRLQVLQCIALNVESRGKSANDAFL